MKINYFFIVKINSLGKFYERYRDNTPISYCPFCGEKFESECTKTLTKTAVKKQITETKEVIEYVLD